MSFGTPAMLAALAAAPAAVLLLWTLWRRRRLHLLSLRGRGGGALLRGGRQGGGRRAALLCAALVLLALAAARPQFSGEEAALKREALGVVFVLDVSQSMAAVDVWPSRFGAAVSELHRLIDSQRTTRVGLVIFAGAPFVRFPLTHDHESALAVLGGLQPGESLVPPGSNIAAAIEAAHSLLRRTKAVEGAIVIVSDGEIHEGDAASAALQAAADGVRVFTAGVGTAGGAAVPALGAANARVNWIDARTGREVVSRLDEPALRGIAAAGGGRYVAVAAPGALSALAADFAALGRLRSAEASAAAPREQYQWFAAAALALLLAASLWRVESLRGLGGRLRRLAAGAALAGLAALLFGACVSSGASSANEAGNRHFAEGRYQEALESYREAQRLAPENAHILLNAGRALHALGEYERAETASLEALRSDDPRIRARALFHAGNHRWAAGDLLGARAAYVEALRQQPELLDAKINLELVNQQLEGELASPPEAASSDEAETAQSNLAAASQDGGDRGEGETRDEAVMGESAAGALGSGVSGQAASPAFEEQNRTSERETAQIALSEALENLPLEDASLEDALAVLDALRAAPDERLATDRFARPLEGVNDW